MLELLNYLNMFGPVSKGLYSKMKEGTTNKKTN